MRLVSETSDKKQRILIVDKKSSYLSKSLKDELEKFDSEVFSSPHLPRNANSFDAVFWIHPELPFRKIETKLIMIFVGKKYSSAELRRVARQNLNYRIISVADENVQKADLERILWFSFTRSQENFLRIEVFGEPGRKPVRPAFKFNWRPSLSKKNVLVTILLFILIYNFLLFSLLGSSLALFYRSATNLIRNNLNRSSSLAQAGNVTLGLARSLYAPFRPVYSFISVALWPDNMIDISSRTKSLIEKSSATYENANKINKLVFQKNKTSDEKQMLLTRLAKLKNDLNTVEEDLIQLNEKVPAFVLRRSNFNFAETLDLLQKTEAFLPFFGEILAKDGERKYLLLFANNMELRPGGGFIGSFGVVNVVDLTVENILIYDVYDADGQLEKHIGPPDPIRKHLNQPNWFLRDSAFSPDFFENYSQAKTFLNTELELKDFAGGILLTTNAIQNIIESYGEIYIPDFEEKVNKDNFYIKAQLYSEKEFFPGSTQKKNFLGSVARQILVNIENTSSIQLFKMLKKSLDEKQMVIYFDNQNIQSYFDSLYWSGKMISPRCISSSDCILDYVFPVDANLGVNKANFFVSRDLNLKVKVDDAGRIRNELIVNIKNESSNNIFPGGTYKNYFQVFLPAESIVNQITKNNVLVETYDEGQNAYKSIGFLVEIPPQKSIEIKLNYQLTSKFSPAGKNTYQLIFQKQIGSKNSDLKLEFELPDNLSVMNQNFAPLVKDRSISYNTSLTADKIFLIELQKK